MLRHRLQLIVCLFLIVATLAVYWQVRNHDFVNYDDNHYVTDNRHVRSGLTWEGTIWAFTATHAGNWHPLTWLSHMLDCQIYGLNPGGHHVTGLLFHLMNTLLLFVVLKQMTGALWRAAFVSALFALHPLHVESVAWVAERKDVVSAFFWLITMWAYVRYVKSPVFSRYLLVLIFFALGLMAKPMVVTLPFVLLLMDYWPLGRLQLNSLSNLWGEKAGVRGALWEKVPLFAIAAVSSVITLVAQQSGGAIASMHHLPIDVRMVNALVSYVSYIGKMIWPLKLAIFYPHPGMLPIWQAAGAGLLLVCISIFVIRAGRRAPYLAVGWLWYLGTLVPVIGFVQVGAQSMADRYTYLPLIGLFIMIAWGVADLAARWRYRSPALFVSTGVVLLAFMICTWLQAGHWKNSITLYEHTLDVSADNHLAHNNLGSALVEQGNLKDAIVHYSEAVRIQSEYLDAHFNLGVVLMRTGRLKEAMVHYFEAVRIKPDHAVAHYNLGWVLAEQGNFKQAISHYSRAVQIKPDYIDAHNNLGAALLRRKRFREAISHFSRVLQIKPDDADAHKNLRIALAAELRYRQGSVTNEDGR